MEWVERQEGLWLVGDGVVHRTVEDDDGWREREERAREGEMGRAGMGWGKRISVKGLCLERKS